jgi:cytochrome c oxidase subunit 4
MKTIRSHLPPLIGLFILLALTCASSYLRLGAGNLALTLGISMAKTALVVFFFMELRKPEILFRLAAFVGILWLVIYFMLILTDYSTRFPGILLG